MYEEMRNGNLNRIGEKNHLEKEKQELADELASITIKLKITV